MLNVRVHHVTEAGHSLRSSKWTAQMEGYGFELGKGKTDEVARFPEVEKEAAELREEVGH